MASGVQGMKRGKGVLFGRDGDMFHVIYDYIESENGYAGSHHVQTENVREAVMNYAGAICERICRELLDHFEKDGYDRHTGLKNDGKGQ